MPDEPTDQPPSPLPSKTAHFILPEGESSLDVKLELPPGAAVTLELETSSTTGGVLQKRRLRFSNPAQAEALATFAQFSLAHWLTGAALALYLITRLFGLSDFPLYFFSDEAVQTNLAADLVRDDFRSYTGELLPTFFENGSQYNLSTSVYLQIIPYLLFGKAIWVTRGTAVLMSLLAALALWRILRDIFRYPHPWVAVLLLSITPAWFLHSRTAFETALATAFYAGFLYCYLMYRVIAPRYLYGAVLLGALTFYTYSPAQMVMLVSAVLLLLTDARYHWQQRAVVLRGLGLAFILGLPYLRFLINHPGENLRHMQILNSYWVKDIPLREKLAIFGGEYLRGLDPRYWFLPNDVDYSRHLMKGYGNLTRPALPLVLIGLTLALKGLRSAPQRVILVALLAAPSGAALAELGITRALIMVIPAALFAALGLIWLLDQVNTRLRIGQNWGALAVFALLAVLNVSMLTDALVNGPTWFRDYGLGGMQYGAKQLQAAIGAYLREHPNDTVILTPSWTNGTTEIKRFFFDDDAPVRLGGIDEYSNEMMLLDDNTTFVLLAEELDATIRSGKYSQIQLERILFYPDGNPGFYFTRLRRSDDFAAILAAERSSRRALQPGTVIWDGVTTEVRFSLVDMGQIQDGFDGDDQSILRTREANPLVMDIRPAQPRNMRHVGLRVGGTPTRIVAQIFRAGERAPLIFIQSVRQSADPRYVNFDLGAQLQVERILLEVETTNETTPAHVHLWEVRAW